MKFYDLIVLDESYKVSLCVRACMQWLASALSPVIIGSGPRKTDPALLHSGKNNACIFSLAAEIRLGFY